MTNHSTDLEKMLVVLFIFMQRSDLFWVLELEILQAKLLYCQMSKTEAECVQDSKLVSFHAKSEHI